MTKVLFKKLNTQLKIGIPSLLLVSLTFGCESEKPRPVTKVDKAETNKTEFGLQQAVGARGQMIATADQLKSSISIRFPELQTQRDRQGKITGELLNQTDQGCFSKVSLQKFEILVQGSWLPRKVKGNSNNPLSGDSQGNPTSVTFQFGEQIAVVNDEQLSSMFQPAGRKVVTDFADLKLSDIEFIRIAKGGAAFDSERVCKKSGFLGSGEKCEYQNYEESRFGLDAIELKVNGETFYKREAIQFQLEDGSLEWRDDSMQVNEAYLKLMGRQDCPQG